MKPIFLWMLLGGLLFSCNRSGAPDVSKISVNLQIVRFEKDFFSMDTTDVSSSAFALKTKYPDFIGDYFDNILAVPLDSVLNDDEEATGLVKKFLKDYRFIKDSADKIFGDFKLQEKQIRKGLQYVKYYFPQYVLPGKVITFIGPFDAFFSTSFGFQGDIITSAGLGVGLQLHLGKNFQFYNSKIGEDLFPAYISRLFEPQYIPVNCMHNIIDDLFPPSNKPSALIEQIVGNGRRYYLLTKLLPDVKDSVILGYTRDQMDAVSANEAVIWDFFLKGGYLNTTDQNIIKNYIGPSPSTQEFGQGSPGNIGSFSGLQIVRKYMEKFPSTTLGELMKLSPREIYERSKYKPRL